MLVYFAMNVLISADDIQQRVHSLAQEIHRDHPDGVHLVCVLKGAFVFMSDLARHIWDNARSFFERSASGETQVLEQYLVRMFVTAGEALAGDVELRTEINQGLVAVLRTVVAEQKSGVSTFISDQVKSWDMGQLISLIEINIGRDLQYIRFNGSLIGGLAGLALYTLEYLLRLL